MRRELPLCWLRLWRTHAGRQDPARNGANPNAAGQSSITPLIAAVVRGHTELADLLLNLGADLNISTREGVTALMAAVNSNPEAAPLLLKRGAEINAADQTGITALHAAAAMGKADVVRCWSNPAPMFKP